MRPRQEIVRNQGWLTEAFNVVADDEGLIRYVSLSDPFEGNEVVSFPFPQLFKGFEETLLASELSVGSVTEGTSPWTSSELTLYDPSDIDSEALIAAGGGIWHFADLGRSWWLVNDGNVIFKAALNPLAGSSFSSEKVWLEQGVGLTTICEHRGRVICAGFSGMWDSRWSQLMTEFRTDMPSDVEPLFQTFPSNYVMWSSPGGADFPLWLMFPDGFGGFDVRPDKRAIISSLEQGLWGVQPATFKGQVHVVKALGDSVMVYGDDGITRMRQSGYTYSREHLASFGVDGRGSVGGDEEKHFFLSNKGELWTITRANPLPQRLGYAEFLSGFLGSTHLIAYNQEEDYAYISDGTTNYVFGSKGLTETLQSVTSVVSVEGSIEGIFADSTATTASEVRLASTDLDFGIRGIKMITQLHIGGDYDSGDTLQVAIDYRFNRNDSYSRTSFHPVNKEGAAYIRASGTDFRVVLKYSDYTTFHVDYIQVMFHVTDRRFRRGPNASQTSQLNA